MAKCNTQTSSGGGCTHDLHRCKNCGTLGCTNAPVYCPNSIQKPNIGSSACKACGKWEIERVP